MQRKEARRQGCLRHGISGMERRRCFLRVPEVQTSRPSAVGRQLSHRFRLVLEASPTCWWEMSTAREPSRRPPLEPEREGVVPATRRRYTRLQG